MTQIDLSWFDDDYGLIVLENTGVLYSAQTGGISCHHQRAEGFYLPTFEFAPNFEHCFCCSGKKRDEIAKELDRHLSEDKNCKSIGLEVKFDFDRLGIFEEGWWPLLIKGIINELTFTDWTRVIYHSGNCD